MEDYHHWKTISNGTRPLTEDNFEKKMTSKKCPHTSMEVTYGALQFHVLLEVTYGALHAPLEVTYEVLNMSF